MQCCTPSHLLFHILEAASFVPRSPVKHLIVPRSVRDSRCSTSSQQIIHSMHTRRPVALSHFQERPDTRSLPTHSITPSMPFTTAQTDYHPVHYTA